MISTTLQDRIKWAMARAGKNQRDVADAVGCVSAAVGRWVRGETTEMSASYAFKAGDFLGVSPRWLATGLGDPMDSTVIAVDPQNRPDEFESVEINEYDVSFGAGSGQDITYDQISESRPVFYRRDWFQARRLNPSHCRRFAVHGESMEPLLFDGDRILVDCSDTSIRSGKVYAFATQDGLRVKRLIRKFDGSVVIKSENPSYPEETVRPEDWERLASIVGRVIDKSGNGGL